MGFVKGAEDKNENGSDGADEIEVDGPVKDKALKGKKRLQEEEPREAEKLKKKRRNK